MTSTSNTVELLGTYGGDETHALSAWTSTKRELTEEKRERIGKMLKQLADNGHETPFEKSGLHFLVTSDIASHIHLIKHRIGVSVNAESARYKELRSDKYYVPEDWPDDLQRELSDDILGCYRKYHSFVERLEERGYSRSRAKESARYILPYANQITQDVMFNFRSFINFLRLRLDDHAQLEIREIARQMVEQVREIHDFDLSLEAFGYGEPVLKQNTDILGIV